MRLTGQVCVAESVSVVSCLTVQLVRLAHLAIGGIATRLEELKYLFHPGTGAQARGQRRSESLNSVGLPVPPGYRGSGPRPAAVGVTELGGVAGAAEGKRSANGTWPPRGPLEDWSGPVVGLMFESRVQVALIRVAAKPVRNVRAGQRWLLCGECVPASYPNPT